MKFAKRLEAEAVAEWRPKYLQYKQLKKLIKVIAEKRHPTGDVEKGGSLTSDEVLFFETFESELMKIEEFYKVREKEAVDKKFKIMAQLHILPEESGKKSKKSREVSPGRQESNLLTWRSLPGPDGGDLSGGSGDEGGQSSQHQFSIKSGSPRELPEHLKISSLRPASFTHLARMRIKKALLEFYRSLELIRNFKTLNILGCAKILKKYDKNTGRQFSAKYMDNLRSYTFYRSHIVDSLMTDVENIYRWVFTEGDRSKALRKLRVKDLKNETFHTAATVGGMALGLCLMLIWRLAWFLSEEQTPMMTQMLGVIYYALGLPFMMCWLFALNAHVWERYYVNYRFIFEFNQRNNLHVCQYSALVGVFSVFYLLLVTLSLEGWVDNWVMPILQPWIILSLIAIAIIFPLNFFYRCSRIWFARVTVRIITAPFYPCRFKDFFINDQYMSLGATFEMFGALIYYTFSQEVPTSLGAPVVWYVFVLQMLPGLWRSLQCLRRFHDSKMAFPHLANLAKYCCSLLVILMVCLMKATQAAPFWYILIVARLVSSIFSLGWDIVMDFGLWQRSTVNDRLRSTILFRPWIYWYLIVSDTLARFLWVLPLIFTPTLTLSIILWTTEALRRFQWNFFRVEYEHVNNCNVLRAIADVQLPFTATDLFYQDMVETIQQQRAQAPAEPLVPSTPDGLASPASSVVGDDLDEEEYGEELSYEQQLEMVQKSAAEAVSSTKRSPIDPKNLTASGWSSPGGRPQVSTMFNGRQHGRKNTIE